MTLTLEFPETLEYALKEHAASQGVSESQLILQIIRRELADPSVRSASNPKQSAYGIFEKYGPSPSEEEIDENRRDMLRGFSNNQS